jgi:hypothetical protein
MGVSRVEDKDVACRRCCVVGWNKWILWKKKARANYLLGEEVGLTQQFLFTCCSPNKYMKLLPVNIHVKPSSTT